MSKRFIPTRNFPVENERGSGHECELWLRPQY
jgi:hypothetical protein